MYTLVILERRIANRILNRMKTTCSMDHRIRKRFRDLLTANTILQRSDQTMSTRLACLSELLAASPHFDL